MLTITVDDKDLRALFARLLEQAGDLIPRNREKSSRPPCYHYGNAVTVSVPLCSPMSP